MKTSRLALAVIVLAGGWLGATAYTKHSVAKGYTDQIAKLEKRLPILHVSGLKQEGGFFSGTFSGVMYLGCAPVGGKPHPKSLAIAFEDKVQYGPLPGFTSFGAARVDTHFALTEAAPVELRGALAQLAPAQIHTDYGYGGGAHTRLVMPAGEVSIAGGPAKMKMRWAELRAQATATRDATQAQYDWSLPELVLNVDGAEGSGGGGMKMTVKNLLAKGESSGQPNSWLREGREDVSVENMAFEVTAPQQPPVTMVYDHMSSHAVSQLKQGFMDVGFGYAMNGLEMQVAGKDTKLANLALDGKLQHLDAAAIEQMLTALFASTEMGCAVTDEASAERKDPRVVIASMFKGVDEASKALMAHDPAFSIDKLAFDLNGKRGEMSMSAKLHGLDVAAMAGPQSGQALARAGQLQAKARIPLAWLAVAGGNGDPMQAADAYVAMGFAKRDGEFLTAEFTFADGVAKLNGAVFPQRQAQQAQ